MRRTPLSWYPRLWHVANISPKHLTGNKGEMTRKISDLVVAVIEKQKQETISPYEE